jgi:Thioesterase-like superfamily
MTFEPAPATHGGIEAATAMSPLGAGRWATDIDHGWSIGGRPNGGYLLAVLASAACAETGRDLPLGVNAVFTAPPEFGPAVVVVDTIRAGRTVTAVRARIEQGDLVCAEALCSVSDAAAFSAEPVWTGSASVDLPPVEECVAAIPRMPDGTPVPILESLDVRLDPACIGWYTGHPGGVPEMRAWVRERGGVETSPLATMVATDTLAPVVFELGLFGWSPTVQMSVGVRSAPAPGWLRVRSRAHLVADGWFDEDVDVWDSTGRLVTQARQLAQVGRGFRGPVSHR